MFIYTHVLYPNLFVHLATGNAFQPHHWSELGSWSCVSLGTSELATSVNLYWHFDMCFTNIEDFWTNFDLKILHTQKHSSNHSFAYAERLLFIYPFTNACPSAISMYFTLKRHLSTYSLRTEELLSLCWWSSSKFRGIFCQTSKKFCCHCWCLSLCSTVLALHVEGKLLKSAVYCIHRSHLFYYSY